MFALLSVELVIGIAKGIGMFIGATVIPFALKYLYKKAKATLCGSKGGSQSKK
jgi:hypothetical protein